MKKLIVLILILSILLVVPSCSETVNTIISEPPIATANPTKNPNIPSLPAYSEDLEFEFSLSFGAYGRSNINTFEDTITKDLVSAGKIKTEYIMPESIRKEIYLMLEEMDIMNFPSDLSFPLSHEQDDDLNLQVIIEGEERTVRWIINWDSMTWGPMIDNITAQHRQFQELVEFITKTVYESEEWKSLPKAEGGYI